MPCRSFSTRGIASTARALRDIGGTVYLRPMHEMNGNWSPWGAATADNTPARALPVPATDRAAADEARAKNRRITIEDLVVASKPGDASTVETKPGETKP